MVVVLYVGSVSNFCNTRANNVNLVCCMFVLRKIINNVPDYPPQLLNLVKYMYFLLELSFLKIQ